ncbi:MAG: PAS domain-containing sensor histidine kinase [Gammaproteobacteria bacterium]|nr:PAS domain-containing sensor histidine kinase [Gammaproteobacteria bacterium]MDH3768387.1 PAS domain-containing sensor histidine kinase [Gammaproteobacteria bacterium]
MQEAQTTPTRNRVEELERAFSEFTDTSLQLEEAYRELEGRAETLSAALASAQDERLVELAEKEKLADRLQGLLETLPAGVIVLDGQGIVQECNPGARALLGEELAGYSWTEIIEERFAMEGDGAGEFMLRSGHEIALTSCPLKTQSGRILLMTDVTETRRMQKLLARNKRLTEMGQMNARLAHQLRTPLATAVLYASQLTGEDASSRSVRYAEKILISLKHLERMVNDMLRFAGDSTQTDYEQIEVNQLFAEVAAHMESQLVDGAILEFGSPAGLIISAHREALVGALLNLTTNASENSDDQAHIVLHASQDEGHIKLSVSDNGPGIADSDKERIFEPFYTTRANGTGLGLAVVASVARGHGGTVEVRDRDSGGAIFSIVLPLAKTPVMASGKTASSLSDVVEEVT